MRKSATRSLTSRAFSRLAVLIGALALFGQLLALPYHHPHGRSDHAEVAAFLKATFGDAAVLCVDDDAHPAAPEPRHHHGDGDCPLCQFGAQTVLFASPAPTLPEPIDVAAAPLPVRVEFWLHASKPNGIAQPRAPPSEA
ncbi:MAG TPA: hypothetical protein VGH40_12160 [Roseiarcus sp.]